MSIAVAPARVHREAEFLRRYDQLLKLAQKLSDSDRGFAQDIVHDAFVQFMMSSTDHGAIDNIDHYLHKVVRNVHRTHLRQRLSRNLEQLPDDNTDTMPISFTDPQGVVQAQNLLLIVCKYVCQRKETSIAISVLVLRFLHGYYPHEVAKLTRRTRSAVDGLLKSARRDLKDHLSDLPLHYFKQNVEAFQDSDLQTGILADVLGTRNILFEARKGKCFELRQMAILYSNPNSKLTRLQLSHLVSCPYCLDQANRILHLPLLRERFPSDSLSKIPVALS
jgi:RNA polymerase sigma factor (sigma-70 family)